MSFFTDFENDANQGPGVRSKAWWDSSRRKALKDDDIGGQEFRIIGVVEKREQLFGGDGSNDINNSIFMPFNVARKLKPNEDDITILAVARPNMIEEAKDQITDLLRVRRQVPFSAPNNFGMATADSIIDKFRSSRRRRDCDVAILAVASWCGMCKNICWCRDGRTREIGVRKASRARRKDILNKKKKPKS